MYHRLITLSVLALMLGSSAAFAQCGCNSSPVSTAVAPSYTTSYYAPAAADYAPAPYTSYYAAPVSYATYYAPAAPVSYATYYAPAAPAPYVSYYAPAVPYATYYSPAPVVMPYRAYYGVPGRSVFGAPRVYVPGEPVRNAVRAVTP
jgi:hypothetical protein